jgi:hypothetical protein
VTFIALAIMFVAAAAASVAHRWLSLRYPQVNQDIDPVRVQEALSDLDTRIGEHDSKLNALMLERGLRTSKESRA